jgi:predicted metal-dependent hydrolase
MCPEKTDYNARQEWLRKVIVNAIHEEAKRFLPPRLRELAEKHGFKYSQCSVRNSHSRWGSCSGKGNISLSIYLVLLTEELIDYVLLHELCHTVEMNHGERFWAILDKTC